MSVMHSVFAGVDTTVFTDASQDFSRIRWQEYPLGTTGFNIANKVWSSVDRWTITNPDAATLRILLADGTTGVAHSQTATSGLFVVIPTPISSFAPPGVETFSQYRSVGGFAVEWDWTVANVESMGVSVGIIKLDGSSDITTSSTAHRFFRRTIVQTGDTAVSEVHDYGIDPGGGNAKMVSTTAVSVDTIGTKIGLGALGRVNAVMSYDWKDASYNKQESNFGDLIANRGGGTFNPEETWDAGNDKISAVNYYFFMGFSGVGNTADGAGGANSNIIDIKKIRYFVHSLGDWTK
jgi:hypothetical protein